MSPKVINLRGANGSGKTYLIKQWMESNKVMPYPRADNLLGGTSGIAAPEYYRLGDGGVVIGDYTNACGGCDTIATQEEIRARIRQTSKGARYVLFEGVIVSTIFASWLDFSRTLPRAMMWVYLNTPLEVCKERVYARNKNQKINDKLIADKIRSIESTRLKAIEAQQEVVTLRWDKALIDFCRLMHSV